jgi:ketosteroid isomerase-like protein
MKQIFAFVLIFLFFAAADAAQTDLEKIIETEQTFVRACEQKGAKQAFLEHLAPDGVVFNPNPVNGRDFWKLQKDSPAVILRRPAYADVSSNSMLGYTTGQWEFRPNGASDTPIVFGQYVTIWEKQKDGAYKVALDIGVTHEKPDEKNSNLSIARDKQDLNERKYSPFNATARFYQDALTEGLRRPYEKYMANDILLLRQDTLPIYGKEASLQALKNLKLKIDFPKTIAFVGSANLAYMSQTYLFTREGRVVETGNMLKIWKFRNKKWNIVVDLFLPAPDDTLIRN